MRIGMVLRGPFRPDVRVSNEARSLYRMGHEVDLLCEAIDARQDQRFLRAFGLLRLVKPPAALGRANSLAYKTCFVDPVWWVALDRYVATRRPAVLHVHDLPLVRTASLVARRHGLPVVFDMHERWPERVQSWGGEPSLLERLSTYSYRRLKVLERDAALGSERVICASDEDASAMAAVGVDSGRIAVVPNYVDTDMFDPRLSMKSRAEERKRQAWTILYAGTIALHRALDVLIRAMPSVVAEVSHARLLIAGDSDHRSRGWLNEAIRDTRMEPFVELLGWIPYSRVPRLVWESDVAVALFRPAVPQSFSATHKLFQAMALGRPLVVTDVGDLRRHIEAANCALIVPPQNPTAVSQAILRLYSDIQLAENLGLNGRLAVERGYNWTVSAANLVRAYEDLEPAAKG